MVTLAVAVLLLTGGFGSNLWASGSPAARDLARAVQLLDADRPGEARVALVALLSRHPRAPEAEAASYLIAECYEQLGRSTPAFAAQAADAYRQALARYPSSPRAVRAVLGLGRALLLQDRPAEAREALERGQQQHPGHPLLPAILLELGRAHTALAAWGEGHRVLQRLATGYPDAPEAGAAAFELARLLALQGKRADADAAYQRALARDPLYARSRPEHLFMLGELALERGRPAEARRHFLDLYNRHPRSPLVLRALGAAGESLRAEGREREARFILSEGRPATPNPEGPRPLDRIAFKMSPERAGSAGALSPRDLPAASSPAAEKVVQGAGGGSPQGPSPLAVHEKVRALLRARHHRDAMLTIERTPGSARDPVLRAAYQEAVAHLLERPFRAGKYAGVAEGYRHVKAALLPDVKDPRLATMVGESLLRLGRVREAEPHLRQAAAQRGEREEGVILTLARAAVALGHAEEAAALYRRLLTVSPRSPHTGEARRSLAILAERTGDLQGAVDQIEALLRAAAGGREQSELAARLGDLRFAMKQYTQAVSAYRRALQGGDGETLRRAAFRLGDALFALRQYTPAVQAYQDGLGRFPEAPERVWALYRLAEAHRLAGDEVQAVKALRELERADRGVWGRAARELAAVLELERRLATP